MSRKGTLAMAVSCLVVMVSSVSAGPGLLSREVAVEKAVAILKGDPYGRTPRAVRRHIVESVLLTAGDAKCGSGRPQWRFHVHVPRAEAPEKLNTIDGFLVLDARSGDFACAGLPFLD